MRCCVLGAPCGARLPCAIRVDGTRRRAHRTSQGSTRHRAPHLAPSSQHGYGTNTDLASELQVVHTPVRSASMMSSRLAITWLGHGTFHFRTPGGRRLLIDPWLEDNPRCPDAWKKPSPLDAILITHGHSDHATDAARLAKATAPRCGVARDLHVARTERRRQPEADEHGRRAGGGRRARRDGRCAAQQQHRGRRHDGAARRGGRLRDHVRRRSRALLRRRHVALRRHAPHRGSLSPARRVPSNRRPVHDGTGPRREGGRVAPASGR